MVLLPLLVYSGIICAAPSVTSVNPLSGGSAGGTIVTIHGSGFTGATAVHFGKTPSLVFTVLNDTTIQATAPIHVPQAIQITVVTPSGTSPLNPPADYYTYQGDWFAYIPDFGSANVFPVNTATNVVGLPIPVQSGPNDVAFVPDGSLAIAVNSESDSVTLINAATQTPTVSIPIANSFPILAIAPDGSMTAIANYGSGTVTILNLTTFTTNTVPVGAGPTCVAMIPNGNYIFTTDSGSATLTRINVNTLATQTIPFGTGSIPSFMAITPDGNTAVITDDATNSVVIFNPNTLTFGARIHGFSLHGADLFPEVAVTPDGTTAWVTNTSSDTISSVVGLNTATPTFGTSITVGTGPNGIAITPDGKEGYVSNAGTDNISVVTFATETVVTRSVGAVPTDPGITPDQAPVAYFSASKPTNDTVTFNASASLSPVGTIATYAWNFGDGTPVVTTISPTISHTYAHAGFFDVTLTVTNTGGTSTTQRYTGQVTLNNGGPSATLTEEITIPPSPPTNFKNRRCKNKFVAQTEYINRLTWTASTDPTVVRYLLFRNGRLIATLSASGPLKYNDHDRPKNKIDTYTLIAVNAMGIQSKPITIL